MTAQLIIREVAYIDSFRGKWQGLEIQESALLRELRQIATIASIGSSTRIEGSTLTDREVETLLANLSIGELKERDQQEVYGYYEVLELILESHDHIDLTKNNIYHLHKLLLKASTKDEYHRGNYKQLTNKVVANYPGGAQKVIFNTTEPTRVDEEMERVIDWANKHFKEEVYHPLIVTAAFVYEFLSIHPYQDGNGRLSRLLTTLLLLRQDYDFMNYASMETEIEKRKKDYYKVLMDCQMDRYTDQENISSWLIYFLRMLREAIDILEARFEDIKNARSYLNGRQQEIMAFIEDEQPVKIADIMVHLGGDTVHTVRKDMSYLKKENMIRQVGKGRATVYYAKK